MLGDFINFTKGFAFKSSSFVSNGIKIVKVGNLNSNMSESSEWYYIDESEFETYKKYQIKDDDVIVSTVGSWENNPNSKVGKACIFFDVKERLLLNQNAVIIRTNNNEILRQKYLKYLIYNKSFGDYIIGCAQGSANQASITLNDIRNFRVEIPDIKIQDKIISILDSITLKINLNNEINNNLHELCNNMYFELVSQLDDSNSSSKQIKEVSKCVLGGTPSRAKKEYWNGNINWINSGEVNKFRIIDASEKITELGLQKSYTALLPKGTTVLAITGATLGQVSRLEIDSCANQSVIGIIPNNIELNNYIYLSIFNTINDLILKQTGGAQQHINKNDVESHEIIIPNDKLLKEFDERTRSMFDKISITCFENKRLEQLRDTLLPKLMNGEIDLDNIEI